MKFHDLAMALIFYFEGHTYLSKQMPSTNILGDTVIKLLSRQALEFDLEGHGLILFYMVDFGYIYIKSNSLILFHMVDFWLHISKAILYNIPCPMSNLYEIDSKFKILS